MNPDGKRLMRDKYHWPNRNSKLWLLADTELVWRVGAPEWRVRYMRRVVGRHTNEGLAELRLS